MLWLRAEVNLDYLKKLELVITEKNVNEALALNLRALEKYKETNPRDKYDSFFVSERVGLITVQILHLVFHPPNTKFL